MPLQLLSDTGLPALVLGLALVVGLGLGLRATRRGGSSRTSAPRRSALARAPARLRPPRARRLRPRLPRRRRADRARLGGAARRGPPGRGRAQPRALVAVGAVARGRAPRSGCWPRRRSRPRSVDARLPAGRRGRPRRGGRLGPPRPEPQPALARAALRPRHDRRRSRATTRAAEAFYEQATRLQPENPETWYELGLFRQIALGNQCSAYFALNAAYTLDPQQQPLLRRAGRSTWRGPRSTIPKNPACGR